MNQQRQNDLEEIIKICYRKLALLEKKLPFADGIQQELVIQEEISGSILPTISQYEAEYWELMTQDAVFVYDEDEQAAEESLRDVEAAVRDIEKTSPLPTEVVAILKQIRDKLNEPQKPASTKLKATLNLIPAILSFDIELDISKILHGLMEKIRQKKILKPRDTPN